MNKKIFMVFTCVLFQAFFTFRITAQINLEWSKFYHSYAYYSEEAKSLCFDDSSNIYVAGVRKIIRYDPSGNFQWEIYFPNAGNAYKLIQGSHCIFAAGSTGLFRIVYPSNILVLNSKNYVDIQKGSDNFIYGIANDSGNIFTHKYTRDGTLVWSKTKQRSPGSSYNSFSIFQGVGNKVNIFGRHFISTSFFNINSPQFLTYDTLGNLLYDGGYPEGTIKGVRNDYSNTNIYTGYIDYNVWHSDIQMLKLNSENTVLQSVSYNGSGNGRDEPGDIVTDSQGNIYAACRSWGVGVNYDFVVLKFNSNLELLWEYRYNGSENSLDKADKIILDKYGNIFASGSVTLNSHGVQIYTVKLSPDGQLVWSDKFSRYNSINDSNYVNDLQTDNSGNIYLCGKSRDSVSRRFDFVTLKYSSQTSIIKSEEIQDIDFTLMQNYPNPFNPVTNISFNLPERSNVVIDIISSDGRKLMQLANSVYSSGEHNLTWNAETFNSGIYFISFRSGNYNVIKKAVLIK